MDELDRSLDLQRESDTLRIKLIEADLDVAMTFLDVCRTSLSIDSPQHLEPDRLISNAHRAYQETGNLIERVQDAAERKRLSERHDALGFAIADVRRTVYGMQRS